MLLGSLSAADLATLKPHLRSITLQHKRIIYDTGDEVQRVYFPTTSVVSLVVDLATGELVEAAMVGRDGVVGAGSALDGKISLNRAIVQLAGEALECSANALADAAYQSRSLMSALIRNEQAVYAQAQQSVACMAAHDTQARLCRWLLRARDLAGSDILTFTQEFLAEMLGVRRTSVSPVAHTLQQAGMIKYTRGRIEIINVEGLRETACECYESIRRNYSNLRPLP
jgi:CRP-like cAMP-binding protein